MRKRHGFTLVEMLVVMALVLLIMVILSKAFGDGLGTLQRARSIGGLQEKLRAATSILRRDLTADHFDGRRRVSDWEYSSTGTTYYNASGDGVADPLAKGVSSGAGNYPREGYFGISTGSLSTTTDAKGLPIESGCTYEGTDPDGIPSYRVTGRTLRMTVKLRSNNPKDFFSARIPPGSPLASLSTTYFNQPRDAVFQDASGNITYNSQWAEVFYQLVANGGTTGTGTQTSTGTGTQLFSLFRAQAVIVPNNSQVSGTVTKIPYATGNTTYSEFSCTNNAGFLSFNTPIDLSNGSSSDFTTGVRQGALLLDDVISFEIAPWSRQDPLAWWGHGIAGGKSYGAGYSSLNPGVMITTYTYNGSPWPAPMDGIRITIRVWDAKHTQTRQITIYQDM